MGSKNITQSHLTKEMHEAISADIMIKNLAKRRNDVLSKAIPSYIQKDNTIEVSYSDEVNTLLESINEAIVQRTEQVLSQFIDRKF